MGQDKNDTTPVIATPPSGTAAGTRPGQSDDVSRHGRDMGSTLRSVYEETVSEQVPDDLLDLLGKLT